MKKKLIEWLAILATKFAYPWVRGKVVEKYAARAKYSYDYPRPAVTVDLIVWKPGTTEILLIKRRDDPFKDCWALPGGFMNIDEKLPFAAARELKEETGISVQLQDLRMMGVFDDVARDTRGRVISVAFAVRVPADTQPVAGDDAKEVRWFEIDNLPPLAFDHRHIILSNEFDSL